MKILWENAFFFCPTVESSGKWGWRVGGSRRDGMKGAGGAFLVCLYGS